MLPALSIQYNLSLEILFMKVKLTPRSETMTDTIQGLKSDIDEIEATARDLFTQWAAQKQVLDDVLNFVRRAIVDAVSDTGREGAIPTDLFIRSNTLQHLLFSGCSPDTYYNLIDSLVDDGHLRRSGDTLFSTFNPMHTTQ
jgi:hypothetical protein